MARKTLIFNFASVASVNVTNHLLPLVTLPYLMRTLGPEKVGVVAFAQGFTQLFIILTSYGFNLSAPREISICREDKEKVSAIFWSVLGMKILLTFAGFAIFCLTVFWVGRFRDEWLLFLYSFGLVAGTSLLPTWFFQGIERMGQLAVLNLVTKLIFTVSVFIFVRSQADYLYLPLINSLGYLASAALGLWLVTARFRIGVRMPRPREVLDQARKGWPYFAATFATTAYTTGNSLILGLVAGNTAVGYFSAGEKVVKAAQVILGPLSQTIYPHVSRLKARSEGEAIAFLKRLGRAVFFPALAASLLLLAFAPQVSALLLGEEFGPSGAVIRIMAFVPLLLLLSNISGVQGLIAFGQESLFVRCVVPLAAFHVCLATLLSYYFEHVGMAIAVLLTESLVTLVCFRIFYRCCFPQRVQRPTGVIVQRAAIAPRSERMHGA